MTAGGCRMRRIACAMVDLPDPDSPARPSTSPGLIENVTPSTARTGPRGERYSTFRSRMVSRVPSPDVVWLSAKSCVSAMLCLGRPSQDRRGPRGAHAPVEMLEDLGGLSLGAQPGIRHFIDRVIDQREGEGHDRDAETGRDDRPPRAGQ